jgi:predicted ABC-type sugar transport system permease subunit
MWEIGGVIVAVLALAAAVVFYFKSTKQLKITINVLAGFLEGTIKGGDIKFNRNKKGDVVGLVITLHPDRGVQVQVSDEATLIIGEKEPD